MAVLIERGSSVKDYDIPSTIVVYVLVCLLGVGMCFCLRRANRLLPNQLSFQLRPTNATENGGHSRGYDDEEADPEARRGLLSEYNDDDEDDSWGLPTRQQDHQDHHQPRFTGAHEDEEAFGELQSAGTSPAATTGHGPVARTPVFNIADEEEDDDQDEDNNKYPTPGR